MARLDPARPDLDGKRLGDWLAAHGQGERARRVLWDLFTVSSLNVAGDDANLALAATVVKTALLGSRDAADIGVPVVPLGDLHGRAAADLLGRLGAQVRLSAKAAAVEALPSGGFAVRLAHRGGPRRPGNGAEGNGAEGNGAEGNGVGANGVGAGGGRAAAEPLPGVGEEERGGDVIRADGVVLAVPPDVASRLAPDLRSRNGSGPWSELGSSPIVNVHVIYDKRVTRLPFAAAVDSPVQWVFDRTGPSGLAQGPVPRGVTVGGGALRGRPGGQAARGVPARAGGPVPRRGAGAGRRLFRHQGTAGDVPPGTRLRAAAAAGRDRAAGPGTRGRLDRHRVAGHDGGCRAERTERGAGTAPEHAGPALPGSPSPPGRAHDGGHAAGCGDRTRPGRPGAGHRGGRGSAPTSARWPPTTSVSPRHPG